MPLGRAAKLIEKAQEEEAREAAFRLWLVRYPLYDTKNYETFEQFYDKSKPQKITVDTRNTDDIMDDIRTIEQDFVGRG